MKIIVNLNLLANTIKGKGVDFTENDNKCPQY